MTEPGAPIDDVPIDDVPIDNVPINPKDPDTLYAEGPVAAVPPDDDLPDSSPLADKGGTGPGPDDLD